MYSFWKQISSKPSASDAGLTRLDAQKAVKRDTIVEELRRRILGGDTPRGTRMRQDELAKEFGSSITPVREALRLLEAEGLLVSEPRRGARVASIDFDRVKATYVVRRLVETYAMRRVTPRLSPLDLSRAGEISDRLAKIVTSGDLKGYRAENRAFHFFFYERCAMPGLIAEIELSWRKFPWDLGPTTPERAHQAQAEHEAILAGLEAVDGDGVAEATELHIAHGFQDIARRIADDGEAGPDPYRIDVP
jgi:DNA-binding GntR family transcriptional regulator